MEDYNTAWIGHISERKSKGGCCRIYLIWEESVVRQHQTLGKAQVRVCKRHGAWGEGKGKGEFEAAQAQDVKIEFAIVEYIQGMGLNAKYAAVEDARKHYLQRRVLQAAWGKCKAESRSMRTKSLANE
eukprot:scaffold168_cov147-Skeletonema_dohrnii-CCMP3373.AAC.3